MPIYEFECLGCRKRFEYLVRHCDEEVACPHCAKTKLRRLISSFSFTSQDSSGSITASSSSGCSRCTSHNCSSCGH
ncbi:MAG: zinc ribbon domain-containing protein [Candidatus Omnitrophica bacterium]|nr:zinc ribbon domain-containing protein [Candidatus Omnitrophota bacterium]